MKQARTRKKAVLAAVVALGLTAFTLAGCSKGGKAAESTPGGGQASQQGDKAKVQITVVPFNPAGFATEETNKMQKAIEDKFNVTLKNEKLDIFNADKMNLYFAEGKLADWITLVANIDWRNLADQGLLRPIPDGYLEKYAPKWMEKMEKLLGKDLVESQLKYKGKIYGLPTANYSTTAKEIVAVRKDWMDNLGIPSLPETIGDIHDLAVKFTNNDPDKNGKKDTYAFHNPETIERFLFAAYGIQKDMYFLDSKGKVQFANITDSYKEALRLLASYYKEGLIDPEFVTDDNNKQKQKVAEGKFGILSAHPWMFADTTPPDYNYPKMTKDKNPQAAFAYIPAIKGPSGVVGAWEAYPDIWATAGVFFSKNATDEKIAKVLQIKESFVVDPDWGIRAEYGIQGETYTKSENGLLVLTPEAAKPETQVKEGLKAYSIPPVDWDQAAKYSLTPGDLKVYDVSKNVAPIYGSWGGTGVAFPAPGSNAALKQYGATVDTIAKEFYFNVIIGKKDVDKDWESYKKSWLDSGGAKIIENYQRQHDGGA